MKQDTFIVTEGIDLSIGPNLPFDSLEQAREFCSKMFINHVKVLNITLVYADRRKKNRREYFPIEFAVVDKLTFVQNIKMIIYSDSLSPKNLMDKFYPFCIKADFSKRIIEVVPKEQLSQGSYYVEIVK